MNTIQRRIVILRPGSPRRRWGWVALAPWVVVGYLVTGFYTVRPDEQAVVRRCGRVLAELRGPGLHFGFPYGIDKVTRIKPRQRKQLGVGIDLTNRVLGRRVEPRLAEGLTGDRNLIVLSAMVQYRIADPKAYLFGVDDAAAAIRNATASALASVVASMNVDDVLTVQRSAIRSEVVRRAQEILDGYGAGVRITSVSLEGLKHPEEVADAFRDVNSAREDRHTAVNEAQGYLRRIVPQAQGEARRIRLEAEGYSAGATRRAEGEASRFEQIAAQLNEGRELTIKRLILETMEEVLPRMRKIVIEDGEGGPLDLGIIEEQP